MSPLARDRLGSVLMLAFIASLWVQRDYMSPFGGLFPDTIMALMAFFAVVSLALSFMHRRAPAGAGECADDTGRLIDRPALRRVIMVVVLLSLWVGFYRSAGYALSGTLGFAAIAWYLGDQRGARFDAIKALAVGATVAFVVYLVFDYFLQVPLPPGFLFD